MEISKLTNKYGKDFLKTWCKGYKLIKAYYSLKQNWFYVLYEDKTGKQYIFNLPHKNGSCKPSFFGDLRHFINNYNLNEFTVFKNISF